MAAKKKTVTGYEIKVKGNTTFCGIGAGGVQFAYGKAQITDGRMVEWFREHDSYEVVEITTEDPSAELSTE